MNIHVTIILPILRISGRKRNVNRKYILSIHVDAMVRQKFDRSWNELSTFYLPARLTTINHFATRNIKGVQTRAYVSSSLLHVLGCVSHTKFRILKKQTRARACAYVAMTRSCEETLSDSCDRWSKRKACIYEGLKRWF